MKLRNKYGHFSKGGSQFVITRPDTPRPWFNYLFNDSYHAIISHTGGGFSYHLDAKSHRVLRYYGVTIDRPGRYVFVHDRESDKNWSINWQPVREKSKNWQAVHSFGYTTIASENYDIEGRITYFVPLKGSSEFWLVELKNLSSRNRKLSIFSFADFVAGDMVLENDYHNIMALYNRAYFSRKLNAIIACKIPFSGRPEGTYCYMSSTRTVVGFDCDKEKFLGHYASVSSGYAEAVRRGKCFSSEVSGKDMVGVLEHDILLKPSGKASFAVIVGFAKDKREIRQVLSQYQSISSVRHQLIQTTKYWEQRMDDSIQIETPDEKVNLMLNKWGKYQLYAVSTWRGTSPYHGAEGGWGYRDVAQDTEAILALDEEKAKNKLLKLLHYQYKNGHAVSGWSEIDGAWENSPSNGAIGKSDVAIWLVFAIIAYLKETGDFDFLKKIIPFHDNGRASVYEHVLRAVRYVYANRGKRGLPLIGKADWNDAYDQVGIGGKGESAWLGMALCRALIQVRELAEFIGDVKVLNEMNVKYREMKNITNRNCWDGKWYLAAYSDEGRPIGSTKCREGKLPLNSQTWAILSGIAGLPRANRIMRLVDTYLDTEFGPALFHPAYTKYNPGIGRVTSFAPGTKENAAVFSHACAFKVVADCILGHGNRACETFKKVLPMNDAKEIERYKAEPYVYAEYVIGPGSSNRFGEGSYTWNTGTAAWMFLAGTEYILGVRREFSGLRIDPCLSSSWKKCHIRRRFRNATYDISILNPDGVEKGIKKLVVDGREVKGNVICPHRDGKVHFVRAIMGVK